MKINRPLSPHLNIYKPQLTSTLSIFHRISGSFLVITLFSGLLALKVLEFGLSFYPVYNTIFFIISYAPIIELAMANLISLAFCYHISNGVRHILWDFGFFLDLSNVYLSGRRVLISSMVLLILLNILFLFVI